MQHRRIAYSPDSDSGGSGRSPSEGSAPPPPGSGGELGGAGGSDGVGSNASGPANLNDDDLGAAGLGVANLESSATGNSGPIDPRPLPGFDEEAELADDEADN